MLSSGNRQVSLLAMSLGTLFYLLHAMQNYLGDYISLSIILVLAVSIGAVLGLILVHISAFILGWFGRLLGGIAENDDIRLGITYASIPVILILGSIFLVTIPYIGIDLFQDFGMSTWRNVPKLGLLILTILPIWLITSIWIIIIQLKVLSEVHQFSTLKALISALVTIIILLLLRFSISTTITFFGGFSDFEKVMHLFGL